MASKIHKTVFTVVVYSREPYDVGTDLEDVLQDITDGPCIGEVQHTSSEIVPPEKVRQALIDIGNDGSFFEDDLEDDDGD